jgi:peptidoglycan/xylan/chitin deacetylase (PgdA/CDA1 family)
MSRLKTLLKTPVWQALSALGPRHWPLPRRRLLILTYHRILPVTDPRYPLEQPGMVVTPQTFESHLLWLRDNGFEFEHLSASAAGSANKCCVITFDDGWLDNYQYAYPVLKRLGVPFHIYVVLNQLSGAGDYWPGRLTRILAACVVLRNVPDVDGDADWFARLLPDGKLPEHFTVALVDCVIVACKQYPESFIYERLGQLERQVDLTQNPPQRVLLSACEIDDMLASGLLELGCHTMDHTRLIEGLPAETLEREIVASRDGLERQFGRPIKSFCYPNGDYSPDALNLVRRHYDTAVTTVAGWNFSYPDRHQLRRISMHEDATDTRVKFWAKVSGWL